MPVNILFVCSKNQWRSPTAEAMFRNSTHYAVRSAGTSDNARVKISSKLLEWADMIFVMENKHKQILRQRFDTSKEIVALDIPDEYQYMDEELVDMIRNSLMPYLEL